MNLIAQIKEKLKREVIFLVSIFLAIVTSFINKPKISYIDFKVVLSLFNLMIVIQAFKKMKILDKIAFSILTKSKQKRHLSFLLITLTFISSMFITNDVSLITFVPLTLIIAKKSDFNPVKTIIFQTLAANIGSSLTPMGNPQNLFLFNYFKSTGGHFFSIMIPFVGFGFLWLMMLNLSIDMSNVNFTLTPIKVENKKIVVIFSMLFFLIVLSVFKIIDYKFISLITVIVTLLLDKKLLIKVDYFLLFTFIGFFIFIGNVANLPHIRLFMKFALSSKTSTYLISIFLSQIISNVPCAILLSSFTSHFRELLLGVNIGGIGTIIGSLASLISYKIYVREYNSYEHNCSSNYLKKFSMYNTISLLIFTLIFLPCFYHFFR